MRLRIHRDGRLLIAENGEPDRAVESDPLRAFVMFEVGLTSVQLMRTLRPWAKLIGRAAWMDVTCSPFSLQP
jgi:hypothetical protein